MHKATGDGGYVAGVHVVAYAVLHVRDNVAPQPGSRADRHVGSYSDTDAYQAPLTANGGANLRPPESRGRDDDARGAGPRGSPGNTGIWPGRPGGKSFQVAGPRNYRCLSGSSLIPIAVSGGPQQLNSRWNGDDHGCVQFVKMAFHEGISKK